MSVIVDVADVENLLRARISLMPDRRNEDRGKEANCKCSVPTKQLINFPNESTAMRFEGEVNYISSKVIGRLSAN